MALFPTFGPPEVHEDLAPLTIEQKQKVHMDNLRDEVHNPISSFSTAQRQVFIQIVGANMTSVTSSPEIEILPAISATSYQLQVPLHYNPTSIPPSNLIPSLFRLHPPSLSPSRMYLLYTSGRIGKTLVSNGIQIFLQLQSKYSIAAATSAMATQVLRGQAAHFPFKIAILCRESDSCNVPV